MLTHDSSTYLSSYCIHRRPVNLKRYHPCHHWHQHWQNHYRRQIQYRSWLCVCPCWACLRPPRPLWSWPWWWRSWQCATFNGATFNYVSTRYIQPYTALHSLTQPYTALHSLTTHIRITPTTSNTLNNPLINIPGRCSNWFHRRWPFVGIQMWSLGRQYHQ